MQGTGSGRGRGAVALRLCRAAALIGCLAALAGCKTDGHPAASLAGLRGPSVAFDSIDGPPPEVFRKLVRNLNDEAQQRQLPVISRADPSSYRVRGYLAAQVKRGHTAITWLWDVYDAQQRRALRISGAETRRGKSRDAWAVADDAMLRRIAHASMEQLAAFLAAAPAPAAAPAEPDPAVAWTDTSTPEGSGIFRIAETGADPVPGDADAEAKPALADAVPLPRKRPATLLSGAGALRLAGTAR